MMNFPKLKNTYTQKHYSLLNMYFVFTDKKNDKEKEK